MIDLINERKILRDSIDKCNAEEQKFKNKMAILNSMLIIIGSILFMAILISARFLIRDKLKRDVLRKESEYLFQELTVPDGYTRIKLSPYIIDRAGDTLLIEESTTTDYTYSTMTKDQRNEARLFFRKRRSKDR